MPWRSNPDPAYSSVTWKKARRACLEAAGWQCQIRGPGCQGAAVAADHVFGLKADPQHRHLQAACKTCHDAKTSSESSRGHRDPPAQPRTRW